MPAKNSPKSRLLAPPLLLSTSMTKNALRQNGVSSNSLQTASKASAAGCVKITCAKTCAEGTAKAYKNSENSEKSISPFRSLSICDDNNDACTRNTARQSKKYRNEPSRKLDKKHSSGCCSCPACRDKIEFPVLFGGYSSM